MAHAANAVPPGDSESMREAARRYIGELQDFMEEHSRMLMSLIVASAYSPESTEGVGDLEAFSRQFACRSRQAGHPPPDAVIKDEG